MPIRGKLQRLTEKTAGLRFSSRKWDEGKDPHDHHPANNFDRFRNGIENMIDMPERTLNKLFGFLRQDQGRLSKRHYLLFDIPTGKDRGSDVWLGC